MSGGDPGHLACLKSGQMARQTIWVLESVFISEARLVLPSDRDAMLVGVTG